MYIFVPKSDRIRTLLEETQPFHVSRKLQLLVGVATTSTETTAAFSVAAIERYHD
jgi:hypothetical protein